MRDVPHAAWVIGRAFTASRRPAALRVLHAAAMAVTYLPILVVAARKGTVAVSPDQTAIMMITPHGRPISRRALLLAGGVIVAALVGAITWTPDGGSPPRHVQAPLATGTGLITMMVTLPTAMLLLAQAGAALRHQYRIGGVTAAACTVRLCRLGLNAWAISSWASWPQPGRGGHALATTLLPLQPTGVWLVASAADNRIAAQLTRRGFVAQPGHPLLLIRPPHGDAEVPDVVTPRRRSAHE